MARRRTRADILKDLRRLADEVAALGDTRIGRQVGQLISGAEHMREPLPEDFDPIEAARQQGKAEAHMMQLRADACHDPELVEAIRAKAWLRAGLPEGTVVRADGDWITGLPDGWPAGVSGDEEVERHVASVLDGAGE